MRYRQLEEQDGSAHSPTHMGFSVGFSDDEPIEGVFQQNVQFAECWHRVRFRDLELLAGRDPRPKDARKIHLRKRLRSLFDELPEAAVRLITDDKDSLIAQIVRTRNSLIHSDNDSGTSVATGDRLKVVVMKLGVILWLHVTLVDYGEEDVEKSASRIRGNLNFYKYLRQSDRPDDSQARLPGL